MGYFYHGSVVGNLTVLEPHKRYTPSALINFEAIYATPVAAFAAAHAFPWSSEDGIDIVIEQSVVTLLCPSSQIEKLSVPISIYKVSDVTFVKTTVEETGYTWHSLVAVPVVEELRYADVATAMTAQGGHITYLP